MRVSLLKLSCSYFIWAYLLFIRVHTVVMAKKLGYMEKQEMEMEMEMETELEN